MYDVIIIGGGASGMLAAVSAAEHGSNVLILEKMNRAGRKMLISGKGRCNITNTAYQSEFFKKVHPRGKFLKHAFAEFFSKDIIKLLEENGLKTKTERGGRIFPESDKASDVVKTLERILKKKGIELRTECKVSRIITEGNEVQAVEYIRNREKHSVKSKCVILCTGGRSYPATGSTGDGYRLAEQVGHSVVSVRPALVPLEAGDDKVQRLQGLSLKNVKASLYIDGKKIKEEFGEMLFTHFGLSGPIILTLSKLAVDAINGNKAVSVSVDLKPALDDQKTDARLQRELNENGKKLIRNVMKNILPIKLIPVITDEAEIDEFKVCNQINAKERKRIKKLLKDLRFEITGYRPFEEAIVTAGGIDLDEIDSGTMMSKLVKNLYFAGEIIDLDAETGGYNFQLAFSTGWLAGRSASKRIIK
jgi:predicted Rossmann fold flavoprotein